METRRGTTGLAFAFARFGLSLSSAKAFELIVIGALRGGPGLGSARLFDDLAYQGVMLDVTMDIHAVICRLFPDLAIAHEYRAADSWLVACPPRKRPRNCKRFLLNWFRRSANREHKTLQQERDVQTALNAGGQR